MSDTHVIYNQNDPSLIRNTPYGAEYFQDETQESLIGKITRNLSVLSIATLKQILFLIVAAVRTTPKQIVNGGRRTRRNRKQSKSRRNR
jgi:hypothetical protein